MDNIGVMASVDVKQEFKDQFNLFFIEKKEKIRIQFLFR
jgi:hypothetical protein